MDDDEVIRGAIEFVLLDEGYAVVTAQNGEEALSRSDAQSPCLILLDMKMPVMDGWGFATAYRQRPGPHAPIIVMTAAHDPHSRSADISADGYIAKPFDLDELLSLVRQFAPVA